MSNHHDRHHHDHHDHHHDHSDEGEKAQGLSFEEKLVKIFEHWIQHNEDHAQTYVDWRVKAEAHGLDGIATLLDGIAQLSDRLTEKLKAGLDEARKI